MEDRTQVTAALPAAVADEVVASETAVPVPTTRTGIPLADILITGIGVVTTIVSLGQAPAVVEDLARRIVKWRQRADLKRDPVLSVEAAGPNGRISLHLTAATNVEEVTELLVSVLATSQQSKSSDAG